MPIACTAVAGESWRDPVFVIDPQAHGLRMGMRLGSFWCDPKGRPWLFFLQSVGMFDGSSSTWFVRCNEPDAEKPIWSEPVSVGYGASLNKPMVRSNGEWILPVSLWERWHIDRPFADHDRELDAMRGANVFVSDDEGTSWRYRGRDPLRALPRGGRAGRSARHGRRRPEEALHEQVGHDDPCGEVTLRPHRWRCP